MPPTFPSVAFSSERVRINTSWLIKLRWAAFGGQLLTIAVVVGGLGVKAPFALLLAILTIEGLSNLALSIWFDRVKNSDRWPAMANGVDDLLAVVLGVDIVFLTVLLHQSGGPANPFSLFYLANLTLAAIMAPGRSAWALTGLACACYGTLFAWPVPIEELGPHVYPDPTMPRDLRREGLLAAFATSAVVIVYFTSRVTAELARREEELHQAQQLQARSEKLEALGTLAAGAAHELASPLSTIAVVSKELAHSLQHGIAGAEAIEDAQLIREEVERCRTILKQMAADAGQSVGESIQQLTVSELASTIVEGVRDAARLRVAVAEGLGELVLTAPRHGLAQAIRGLVHNALDATEPPLFVDMVVQAAPGGIELQVLDSGKGMDPAVLERAGEPFFTTKQPGKGMGLGLFLARTLVERLGGSLRLEARQGRGIVARVRLPITPN